MIIHGDRDNDTICAISSPPGKGGVILIRVSGPRAIDFTRKISKFIPEQPESHRVYYGFIRNLESHQKIDEVLVATFLNGKSFTGEDVAEISCHGSPIIAQEIIRSLVMAGCRVADKGEFTYRAFMHGKVDLVQAESVLALIESQSKKAGELALAQLEGGVSEIVTQTENELIWVLAHLEASIDFSTEDIEIIQDKVVIEKLSKIHSALADLISTYEKGRKVISGYSVVLAGEPNVGKSSLLNRLLNEERAIVSPIAGTTRDIIQDSIFIDGVPILFRDTAGIRDTTDEIEQVGVERTLAAMSKADITFLILDPLVDIEKQLGQLFLKGKINLSRLILVVNKSDLLDESQRLKVNANILSFLGSGNYFKNPELLDSYLNNSLLFLSSLDKQCSKDLIEVVSNRLRPSEVGDSPTITQARHFETLSIAEERVANALEQAKSGLSPEFLSIELKDALIKIQETIGSRFDDQILDKIFQEFCLGK